MNNNSQQRFKYGQRIHNIRISHETYVLISDLLHTLLQLPDGAEIDLETEDEDLANALADFTYDG